MKTLGIIGVLAYLSIGSLLIPVEGQEQEAHVEHYSALCGFYGLAQAGEQEVSAISTGGLDYTGEQVLKRIENLAVSITHESNASRSGSSTARPGESEKPEDLNSRRVESDRELKNLKLDPWESAYYRAKAERLLGRAQGLWKSLQSINQTLVDNRDAILQNMKKAKWGAAADLKSVDLARSRGTACATGTGTTQGPGSSLVNDIVCICAKSGNGGGSNTQNLCLMGGLNQGWPGGAIGTNFDALFNPCTLARAGGLSLRNIQRLQFNFTRLFGQAIKPSSKSSAGTPTMGLYMYGWGHASSDGACAASSGDTVQYVCLNYKAAVNAGGGLDGIVWYNLLDQVAQKIETIERLRVDFRAKTRELEKLGEDADELYFEAERSSGRNSRGLSGVAGHSETTKSKEKPTGNEEHLTGSPIRQRGAIKRGLFALTTHLIV